MKALTLCLLDSLADNLCKQFGPRSGPDLDPNCFIFEQIFRKSGLRKKNHRDISGPEYEWTMKMGQWAPRLAKCRQISIFAMPCQWHLSWNTGKYRQYWQIWFATLEFLHSTHRFYIKWFRYPWISIQWSMLNYQHAKSWCWFTPARDFQ